MKIEDYWSKELKGIKEFQEIARIENIQVDKINNEMNTFIADQFITSATKRGIERREKMLGIQSCIGTLEERRENIFGKWNKRLPYTYISLNNFIESMVGRENFRTILNEAIYFIEVDIINQRTDLLRELHKEIRDMIPANLVLAVIASYIEKIQHNLYADSRFTFRTNFYPRSNLEALFYDETACRDETYTRNGYKTDKPIDFYPILTEIIFETAEDIREETCCKIKADVKAQTALDDEMYSSSIQSVLSALQEESYSNTVHFILSATTSINSHLELVTGNDIWKVGDDVKVDGSRMISTKINQYIL